MDYLDRHAEESEGEGSSNSDASVDDVEPKNKKRKVEKKDKKKKKNKKKIESSDDEEDNSEDEDAQAAEEMKGFIADEEEEEQEEDEKSEKHESESELDEDDLDLIDENMGASRPKKRIIQPEDSDEDDDDRTKIQKDLFGDGEDDEERVESRSHSRADYRDRDRDRDEDRDGYSDSGQSEDDGFIVHEGGAPRHKGHRRRADNVDGHALDEARDVFGVDDFNFDEFYEEGEEGEEIVEDEEDLDDEERAEGEGRVRTIRKKEKKSTLLDTMDPADLDRGFLSAADKKIMLDDRPERFLLRRTPVTEADDNELELEAQWIWNFAFTSYGRPVSCQASNELKKIQRLQQDHRDMDEEYRSLAHRAPIVIKEVLKFIRNSAFEVPFIAFYRKEILDGILSINELWKVYMWDEKWCHLQHRKMKLLELMKRMHAYQTDTEIAIVRRPLPEADMLDVEGVQTMEQLNDVSAQFHMYYGNELNKMVDWERQKHSEEDPEAEIFATRFKMSSRNDPYQICVENGLGELAAKFGLTARQFADNLEYRKHEVEQDTIAPRVVAADFCCPQFSSAETAIKGAMYMMAREIARQPKVRDRVRHEFRNAVRLSCHPTKLGREQIDEAHPLYGKRYLQGKPVAELRNDDYLHFQQAKEAGHIEMKLSCDHANQRESIVAMLLADQPFHVDQFNDVAVEWNELRDKIVQQAVEEMIVPALTKELHEKLIEEARQYVQERCTMSMYTRLEWAPYQPEVDDHNDDEDDLDEEHSVRVLAIVYALDNTEVSFGALCNQDGAVMDYLRLPHFTRRANMRNPNYNNQDTRLKLEDRERLRKFLIRRRPHCIVIAGENMEARRHQRDTEELIRDMQDKQEISRKINVLILDNEAAKVYGASKMALAEHPDYPPYLRQAVSLSRIVIDPMVEYSHLWNEDEDVFCLSLHPLQSQVPKEDLSWAMQMEFINRVNEVGVDVNRCIDHAHTANLLQFVCGLGPRKAAFMLKTLKQNENLLEARSKLVMLCRMGPKVFMNCAGFIKINTEKVSERTEQYVEILDGSRIHPETYEWARKMAVDALEFDDSGDPTTALEEILSSPEKLRDLDLDAFAEELARQGFGNKAETLYDIRKELSHRYQDWRTQFQPPNEKQLFRILTKESKDTLYEGKLVLGTVLTVVHKRLTEEQLGNKVPMRNEQTGQWQCQWCYLSDFENVNELYNHMDQDLCPGLPVGIKVKLDNGLIGFVPNKCLSDTPESFKNPLERVKLGQPIYCRVKSVNPEKFSVDLSCRSSDLRGEGASKDIDPYFDQSAQQRDDDVDRDVKEKAKASTAFVKRVISHVAFKNVAYREAERFLAKQEQGDAIIRPSSKSAANLTVTWKVCDNVYAHIDVREEEKDKEFTLGKKLYIQQDVFEDLDEILARHVTPMAGYAREIIQHKYYVPGVVYDDRSQLEVRLTDEKRANPSRIPYVFAPSGDYPGKFLLSYLARVKPKHEYMTVTPTGIRFRQQMFPALESLLQWFKVHFRDAPPNQQQQQHGMYRR